MDEAFRLDSLTSSDLPTEFGPFRLIRILGRGAMGRVFEAARADEQLALKVMRPAGGHEAKLFRQVLAKEARLGALLDHAAIVPIRDVGEHDGVPWLALALVDGVDLATVLDEWGALAPRVAVTIAMELASALDHAHHLEVEGELAPIIHRDIKPGNVMLARGGGARLLDFGIAKAAVISGMTTAAGDTRGTPRYMSPEQTRGQPLDGRSDLFSLSALLYEMLVGEALFQGGSLIEIMSSIVAVERTLARPGVFEPAEEAVPGIGAVLRRCLRANPDHRFERGSELVDALVPLLAEVPATPTLSAFVRGVLDGPDDTDSSRAEWEAFDEQVELSGAALDSEKVLRAVSGEHGSLDSGEVLAQREPPMGSAGSPAPADADAARAMTRPVVPDPSLDTRRTPKSAPRPRPSSPPPTPPTNPALPSHPAAFLPTQESLPSQPGAFLPTQESMPSQPGALRPAPRSRPGSERPYDETEFSTGATTFPDTPPTSSVTTPPHKSSIPPGPNPFAELRGMAPQGESESPLWWALVGVAALLVVAVLWFALAR